MHCGANQCCGTGWHLLFLRSDVMEVVVDLSVPRWLLWMPISAVLGLWFPTWSMVCWVFLGVDSSCVFLLYKTVVFPLTCRQISNVILGKVMQTLCPCCCKIHPNIMCLLFEKAVTFWTWSFSLTWNNSEVVNKFSLTSVCERTHGKSTWTCFPLIKTYPKFQETIN